MQALYFFLLYLQPTGEYGQTATVDTADFTTAIAEKF